MIKQYRNGNVYMIRNWLVAMLRGDHPGRPFPEGANKGDIAEIANAQGVIALLHERLNASNSSTPASVILEEHIAKLAREKAKHSLMREAECRRILARLQQEGIKTLLLKGSALAYWLYPSAYLRDCSDIDLLFSSFEETQKAAELLRSMEFNLRDPTPAGDLVSFELTCIRDQRTGSGLEIDLHWRLSSSPVFAYRFDFAELDSGAISLRRLGDSARGLSPVHALFNACMHRVQNMPDGTENNLKWLYDIHLLGSQFTPADWERIVAIAVERKLAGTCLDGLLAAKLEFNTAIAEGVLASLANAAGNEGLQVSKMNRWFYIQRMSISGFPTLKLRMRWLMQRLLPNATYLKARYGETGIAMLIFKRIKAGSRRFL